MKYYSGIGSRDTPKNIQNMMTLIAEGLSKEGYTLRSGGAKGADSAFEKGAGDKKQIFLPWKNFQNNKSNLYNVDNDAYKIAKEFHPFWDNIKYEASKKLLARNSYIILGKDLETPSSFVICWTKDGKDSGGTGQGIRIAQHYEIKIFNLYDKTTLGKIKEWLKFSL